MSNYIVITIFGIIVFFGGFISGVYYNMKLRQKLDKDFANEKQFPNEVKHD